MVESILPGAIVSTTQPVVRPLLVAGIQHRPTVRPSGLQAGVAITTGVGGRRTTSTTKTLQSSTTGWGVACCRRAAGHHREQSGDERRRAPDGPQHRRSRSAAPAHETEALGEQEGERGQLMPNSYLTNLLHDYRRRHPDECPGRVGANTKEGRHVLGGSNS